MNLVLRFTSVAMTAFLLTGCNPFAATSSNHGNKYHYTYKLTFPVQSNDLAFRDEYVYIQFKLDDAAVRFQIQNLSSEPLEIDWSKATIGLRGKSYPVRNTSNLYVDSVMCYPPAVILPMGYRMDLAIPARNIRYDGYQSKEQDLLPTEDHGMPELGDRIPKLAGTSVNFLLPIRIADMPRDYQFTFQVASVEKIPWEKHKLPWRPAPRALTPRWLLILRLRTRP